MSLSKYAARYRKQQEEKARALRRGEVKESERVARFLKPTSGANRSRKNGAPKDFSAIFGRTLARLRKKAMVDELPDYWLLLREFHWDRIGRAHYLCALFRMSDGDWSSLHEMDPPDFLIMLEELDMGAVTIAFLKNGWGNARIRAR